MTARDLINYTIPPLRLEDKVEKAQKWISELHSKHFPVVQNGEYYGIFSEEMLFDVDDTKTSIKDFDLLAPKISVKPDEHYYEILKISYTENLELIAVVSESEGYQGVISIQDVVEAFSKMSSISSPGTILVISMAQIDYSLTEISRIIESEYGKILSSFIENHPSDSSKIRLTLKINLENASQAISALERFGFDIVSVFGKGEDDRFEKERLDTLMKYLKI